jgi:hypothetical protein
MRTLLLCTAAALVLTGCGFDEPPAPDAVVSAPAVAPAEVDDPCTAVVLSLLDGQLVALPSADGATYDKAGKVADLFQQRYDAVIAATGVEAARAQYAGEISTACQG